MSTPLWDNARLANPHTEPDKRARVQKMFGAIAASYDLNNRLHSLGIDQYWRKKTVQLANVQPTDTIIDIACGTGDLTLALYTALLFAKWAKPHESPPIASAQVIGVDFTYAMLPIARKKAVTAPLAGFVGPLTMLQNLQRERAQRLHFLTGDAQSLPLPSACADIVSIAFGIRNVQHVPTALAEFRRILKPGGRLLILEFSQPPNPLIRWLYNLYSQKIMPVTATWLSRDTSGAYKYLPHSVETFLKPTDFLPLLKTAGFTQTTLHPLSFGAVTVIKCQC